MSPEERAALLMLDVIWGESNKLCDAIAAAIRAAEDEALERAALTFEESASSFVGSIAAVDKVRFAARQFAASIRALKSPAG